MKRFTKIALIVAISSSVLMGCGQQPQESVPEKEETVVTTQKEEADTQEVVVATTSETGEDNHDESDANAENDVIMEAELEDLDGNKVNVGELVHSNNITMLNFWGTFCGPCINEMPDLETVYQKYADQGFCIIGMTSDIVTGDGSFNEDLILEAKDIVSATGVTYPVVITSREVLEYCNLYAVPTTYIFDKNGVLVCDPIIGSQSSEQWDAIIADCLANLN